MTTEAAATTTSLEAARRAAAARCRRALAGEDLQDVYDAHTVAEAVAAYKADHSVLAAAYLDLVG